MQALGWPSGAMQGGPVDVGQHEQLGTCGVRTCVQVLVGAVIEPCEKRGRGKGAGQWELLQA